MVVMVFQQTQEATALAAVELVVKCTNGTSSQGGFGGIGIQMPATFHDPASTVGGGPTEHQDLQVELLVSSGLLVVEEDKILMQEKMLVEVLVVHMQVEEIIQVYAGGDHALANKEVVVEVHAN